MSEASTGRPRFAREPVWRPADAVLRTRIPGGVLRCLMDGASLTERMQRCCRGAFAIQVLHETRRTPEPSEALRLGLPCGVAAVIREVRLVCAHVPWVFARTVIPPRTLDGGYRRLAHLGARPLGAVLFADPTMERGPLEIAAVPSGAPLYRRAVGNTGAGPPHIWGRRSVFRLGGAPLLVCELFLPGGPAGPVDTHESGTGATAAGGGR